MLRAQLTLFCFVLFVAGFSFGTLLGEWMATPHRRFFISEAVSSGAGTLIAFVIVWTIEWRWKRRKQRRSLSECLEDTDAH